MTPYKLQADRPRRRLMMPPERLQELSEQFGLGTAKIRAGERHLLDAMGARICGARMWDWYQTHGCPLELMEAHAEQCGVALDTYEFEELRDADRKKQRTIGKAHIAAQVKENE